MPYDMQGRRSGAVYGSAPVQTVAATCIRISRVNELVDSNEHYNEPHLQLDLRTR